MTFPNTGEQNAESLMKILEMSEFALKLPTREIMSGQMKLNQNSNFQLSLRAIYISNC